MNILETLTAQRRADAIERRQMRRSFAAALLRPGINIIAELKRASPSEGMIREDFHPADLARKFDAGGAAALSVLCEPHRFLGGEHYLREARAVTSLPILYKDFLSTPFQIAEAFAAGADAVLLIAAVLAPDELARLIALARDLGMDALVETHDEREIETAVAAGAGIIGVNCRDLRNFSCDASLHETLLARIPDGIIKVAESGIHDRDALLRARDAGANAFLIGTALMRGQSLANLTSSK